MIRNSFLFDLATESRSWKNQALKLGLLISAFILIAAAASVLASFRNAFLERNPSWANQGKTFFTILRFNKQYGFERINRQSILNAEKIDGVVSTAWLRFQDLRLNDEQGIEREYTVAVVSDSFFSRIMKPGVTDFDASTTTGVLISPDLLGTNEPLQINSRLWHERLPYPLEVRGVVPESMKRLGKYSVDILASSHIQRHLTPFVAPTSGAANPGQEQRIKRFLDLVPEYYGIIEASDLERYSIESTLAQLNEPAVDPSSSFRFEDRAIPLVVLDGIDLDPEANSQIYRYITVATAVLAAAVIMIAMSASTFFLANAVQRSEELRIQSILGKQRVHIFQYAISSSLLPLLLISAGIIPVSNLLSRLVQQSAIYKNWRGTIEINPHWDTLLVVIGAFSALFIACRLLPFLYFGREQRLSRSVSTSPSLSAFLASRVIANSLIFSASLLLMIILSMVVSNLYRESLAHVDTRVVEATFDISNSPIEPRAVSSILSKDGSDARVFMSSSPFVDQAVYAKASLTGTSTTVPVDMRFVDANHFGVLNVSPSASCSNVQSGAIIDSAAANALGVSAHNICSSVIQITAPIMRQVRLKGIVPNLPHLGYLSGHDPVIYLPLEVAPRLSTVTLFAQSKSALRAVLPDLRQRLGFRQQSPSILSIGERLAARDAPRRDLRRTILAACSILLASIAVSLLFHARSDIKVRLAELAVLRSIGAPNRAIAWEVITSGALATLASVLAAVPVFLFLSPFISNIVSVEPSILLPASLSVIGALVLVAALKYVALRVEFWKRSAYSCLQNTQR